LESGSNGCIGEMGNKKTCAFISCGSFTAVVSIVIIFAMIIDSAHVINEGTMGIYFVQGALINETSKPGVRWAAPFVTEVAEVTIRPQTETLQPVTAVTKDGIQNTFNDIQVRMITVCFSILKGIQVS
jgi:regulator of protease activity HflC (stomatin/prohibitin superfamily)